MQLFLLGAGRPASGRQPSALKQIAQNTRAMDWQIHSFASAVDVRDIHFLGGYHVEDVITRYPELNFLVIPDWQKRTVLHTFLKAPFSSRPAIAAYSDTIFRKEAVRAVLAQRADIVYAVDHGWMQRYEARTQDDIRAAETLVVDGRKVEFTGLVRFSARAVDETQVGSNLIDLIRFLEGRGLSSAACDVAGNWAEFNSPSDIARFILGTKAETLARLEPLVRLSHIGGQVHFTANEWHRDQAQVLRRIAEKFSGKRLVVRSSSKNEDNWHASNAGGFESLLNVDGADSGDVRDAINTVVGSFGAGQNGNDQVLVQEFVSDVRAAGVVFTCGLESGAPYYRFNFDDTSQSTESVTGGVQADLRTVIVSRLEPDHLERVAPELMPVLRAIQELEQLLGYDKLDIEFAIDAQHVVHIFQVRPVTVRHDDYEVDERLVGDALQGAVSYFRGQQQPSPFVHGNKALFANMPDWNPAEIIGTRPKPLAFSLYRQLITNEVWARQRAEFGYRDVRPCPLIVSFCGQPYVDVRASLNSFIPATVPEDTAARLANAYIDILADHPHVHDKIEFDVAFTVWTPDFSAKSKDRLTPYGVRAPDMALLEDALKRLTCTALTRLPADIASITILNARRQEIERSRISVVDKMFALTDDCKRFGTLAFSHAARAGFVAVTLLKSLVAVGALSDARRLAFLASFDTVAGGFEKDKDACRSGLIGQDQLTAKYGHLRPGTYEVAAPAYWENPERYLVADHARRAAAIPDFSFTTQELDAMRRTLADMGADISVDRFTAYLVEAIQAREHVKFEFTRNLSRVLDYCVDLGGEIGLARDELSYLDYHDLEKLKLNAVSRGELLRKIEARRLDHAVTCSIELPSLIRGEVDFYSFERFASQPNFVTIKRAEAPVQRLEGAETEDLGGKIVMIPQADPGYDWLFGHDIAGLITQYGGANSHMAIRAAEIGLPAAIGVGEKMYEKIANMKRLELDCANQVIREVQ